MAITVYFIDKAWNYREMLLGFEPLHGPHTGINLSDVESIIESQGGICHIRLYQDEELMY
jgi:hypothetical protein